MDNLAVSQQHNIHRIYIYQRIYRFMEANSSLSERIELFLSCRNLKDLDVFSKSDPYVKVSFKRDFTHNNFAVMGRTETIQNNLNPNFTKSFVIDFIFESRQDIRFDVFDDDGKGNDDDYIGYVQTTVGNLMGAKSQTSILDLKSDKNKGAVNGKLVVRCEKIEESSEYLRMKWKAEKLYNTDSWFDFWDKSDPYIKFLKIRDDNSFVEVQRTEWIKDTLDPTWRPVEIQGSRLINPHKQSFRLEVWDWQEDGKDQFIGEATVAPNQLINNAVFFLSNPKVKKPGKIILESFEVFQRPTFVDYLRGGLELNMIVAIDFTGSNGSPKYPNSLHYMNPTSPNQYQMAIAAITQILMNYDSDKRIPAFGFGAKTKFSGSWSPVSHCFVLSGKPQEVEACGVQHLMMMYKNALEHVELSGPTYFGPLIEETMKLAQNCKQGGSTTYQTLLILTDGEIHDMDRTIDLIIQAANLPLSIIIVGIGSANFDNMNRLDGDNGLYSSNGVRCARDIVQFVPFRDVKMNGDILAKQLLAELPGQVIQYMAMIGKPPGKFVPLNVESLIKKQQNQGVPP